VPCGRAGWVSGTEFLLEGNSPLAQPRRDPSPAHVSYAIGKRTRLCCSALSDSHVVRGRGSTSRLASAYQWRTYRIVTSARGVSVVFGVPRCSTHGWRIRTSPISSGTACIPISPMSTARSAGHDTQHIRIEEELRCEAGWLKRHCKKVAMWATVWLRVAPEICEQARPEGVSARVNEARWEVASQNAVAAVFELAHRSFSRPDGCHRPIRMS
jgi:hypothetical protein